MDTTDYLIGQILWNIPRQAFYFLVDDKFRPTDFINKRQSLMSIIGCHGHKGGLIFRKTFR